MGSSGAVVHCRSESHSQLMSAVTRMPAAPSWAACVTSASAFSRVCVLPSSSRPPTGLSARTTFVWPRAAWSDASPGRRATAPAPASASTAGTTSHLTRTGEPPPALAAQRPTPVTACHDDPDLRHATLPHGPPGIPAPDIPRRLPMSEDDATPAGGLPGVRLVLHRSWWLAVGFALGLGAGLGAGALRPPVFES